MVTCNYALISLYEIKCDISSQVQGDDGDRVSCLFPSEQSVSSCSAVCVCERRCAKKLSRVHDHSSTSVLKNVCTTFQFILFD